MADQTAPVVKKDKRAFILEYRFTNRVGNAKGGVVNKVFWFEGETKDARERARKHCEIMGYRYIYCKPFIVDLDMQEELKKKNPDFESVED